MEPDWVWGEIDGDDDESVPPHFNEAEWGIGMEGDQGEENE